MLDTILAKLCSNAVPSWLERLFGSRSKPFASTSAPVATARRSSMAACRADAGASLSNLPTTGEEFLQPLACGLLDELEWFSGDLKLWIL